MQRKKRGCWLVNLVAKTSKQIYRKRRRETSRTSRAWAAACRLPAAGFRGGQVANYDQDVILLTPLHVHSGQESGARVVRVFFFLLASSRSAKHIHASASEGFAGLAVYAICGGPCVALPSCPWLGPAKKRGSKTPLTPANASWNVFPA